MTYRGRVWREGRIWLAEVPLLVAMTQGTSRRNALEMISDWTESLLDTPGFRASTSTADAEGRFLLSGSDPLALVGLMLRRQRNASGLTLAQVAERLGARSHNAYARYEQGTAQPTVEKLVQLLRAVAPEHHLVLDWE